MFALTQADVRNPALVVDARAFVVVPRRLQHRCEAGHSGRGITLLELSERALEGILRSEWACEPQVG